ncbi:MAG: hypothetical protein ACPGU1_07735 [Myxococcota bacterium]
MVSHCTRLLLTALFVTASIYGLGCSATTGLPDPQETAADADAAGPMGQDDGGGEAAGPVDASDSEEEGGASGADSVDEPDAGLDAVSPPVDLCVDASCDDGLDCTIDGCDPETGACTWELNGTHCFIGGACYADGDPHPEDGCRRCDVALDVGLWSALDAGADCDDMDGCTSGDVCVSGVCQGVPVACDDSNDCTADSCAPSTGCVYDALEDGLACDDGVFCTVDEVCGEGVCGAGDARTCDDEDPCTDETCEGDECVPTFNQAMCDDGAPCTSGEFCTEGICGGGAPADCDDGDVCTIDLCDEEVGCVHLPTQNACCTEEGGGCDDANPCTTASCDEATGECIQSPNTAACDDGDACTAGDICAELTCAGTALDCDDDNPCTDDLCSPADGCLHIPQDGAPCDDLLECSTGDVCSGGECTSDTSECACTPEFGDAVRASFIAMGATGFPGDGLNLDEDASTCSPEGDCSDGVDNSLAILAGLANDSIAEAVAGGDLNFLIELRETSPGVHLLSAFTGELAPGNPDCAFSSETCEWWVDKSFLDSETCVPIAALNATIEGNSIVGGGAGSVLPFALPLGDSSLTVTLTNLQFEGELVYTDGQITSFAGVFGGAVPKSALEAAINAVPDEDLPLPKSAILGFMGLLENDIDADGDGTKDALSLGLKVSGIDAVLTGSQ